MPGDIFLYYAAGAFLVPILYGAWLGVLVLFLAGPVAAYILSSGNALEWPAIWCLYSIIMILLPLRAQLYGPGKPEPYGKDKIFG
jgi:hypothetical protein